MIYFIVMIDRYNVFISVTNFVQSPYLKFKTTCRIPLCRNTNMCFDRTI